MRLFWTAFSLRRLIRNLCASMLLLAACRKDPLSLPVFREISMPVGCDLTAVWFADSLHGYASAGAPWEQGALLASADGGQHWQVDTLVQNRLECVQFDAQGRGYACGMDGLVFVRPPGQPHWYRYRMDYCWYRSCFFRDDRSGIAVAGEGFQGGLARKLGPESIWIEDTLHVFPNSLSAVWCSDSLTAHAVGLGWVLRSTDAGSTWTRLDVTGDFFRSVHFPTPDTGYTCGYSGTLLKTVDAGRSWQRMREGGSLGKKNQPFRSLWFVSADKGYVAGDRGLLWRTDNGGASWTPLAGLPESADAADIFVLGHRGWIAAAGGRMFYFED